MAAPERYLCSRVRWMCSQRSRRLFASLVLLLASFSSTESQQCSISPTTIYARVGDQASFSCSHSSIIPPTGFRLNTPTYQSPSVFPGYIRNTYVNGVFTLFFTRTEIFSEQSVVRCVYSQCSTGPAIIRNPDPPGSVDEESIAVQPSLTSIALSWTAATPFPGYPITGYSVELEGVTSAGTAFTGTTNTTSITIQGLDANREYNLAIVTVSGSGNSVPATKTVMTVPLGSVTSPGASVGVLLNGAVNLTWRFTLTADITASPGILLNGTQHSLEELRMMDEVSVEESVVSTSVVLTAVGVEWNGSSWRWVLKEFGGVLLSNETVLFVQGPPLAPPPPTFSLVGPTSVVLTLSDDPPFSPLPITNYTIEYFISDLSTRVTTITVTPGELQKTLTDMQTIHSYTVTVYASSAAGMSQGTTVPLPSFQVPSLPTCPSQTDPHWMLTWSTLFEGSMESQLCIAMKDGSGQALRRCGPSGEWEDPDVSSCHSPEFSQITEETKAISVGSCYSSDRILECLQNISSLVNLLVELINNSDVIFPSDLEVIAVTLQNSTMLQKSAVSQDFNVSLPLESEGVAMQYLQIFDAVFSDTHSLGWALLLEANDTFAGDHLLESFQRLAMILANTSSGIESYRRGTFELQIVPNMTQVSVALPGVVVSVVGAPESGSVVVATVTHGSSVLPPLWPSGIDAASSDNVLVIVESSILEDNKDFTPSVTVTFQFSELLYRPMCARWDFSAASSSRSQGRGAWSTKEVETVSNKWSTEVVCHSTGFGPLTVLTNVQGPGLTFTADPFSIAFYAGSVLAVVFFCFSLAPLVIFTYHDSKAEEQRPILNVSQLNYASVAIVTLIILMAGIESGRNTDTSSTHVSVGCKITASLLHYCFLTLFMWMFCTAVVAFCQHAEVGRELVKRWWSVLILAYSPPVVIVVIAAPIAHPYYGSELGCWLSSQNGTHWAFFAPAILVTLATLVVLVMAMVSVVRNKTEDAAADDDQELVTQKRELAGGIVLYTFVHFPSLCLTWVFGFLYLGTGNVPFAYLYAILLALQSAVFASFQMLRIRRIRRFWTETVHSKLQTYLTPVRTATAPPSVTNPSTLTGRYNADGRLIGGISVLNSIDETPFDVLEETGTNQTTDTYVDMW